MNNKYELKNVINMYVNKNKLSSSLLQKYKIKDEKEKLDIKKSKLDNLENNNNKISNLDINNSASISSQSKSNQDQKSNEETKLELPIIKGIIKKELKNNLNKSKTIGSIKKISFSYSQKTITYNIKDDKEEEKEKDNSDILKKINCILREHFHLEKKQNF
jgi:hypothetical protein